MRAAEIFNKTRITLGQYTYVTQGLCEAKIERKHKKRKEKKKKHK